MESIFSVRVMRNCCGVLNEALAPAPPPRFDGELSQNQRTIGYNFIFVFSLPPSLSFARMTLLLCFPRSARSFFDKRF